MAEKETSLKSLKSDERISRIKKELDSLSSVYDADLHRLSGAKDFYTGENNSQWQGVQQEGDLKVTVPVTSAILQQFIALLTNIPPKFSLLMESPKPVDKARAEIGEDLLEKVLKDDGFIKKFKRMGTDYHIFGRTYIQPWFDRLDETGSKKGTVKVSVLNPFTTRVIYDSLDYTTPLRYITFSQMHPDEIRRRWDVTAFPDSEYRILPTSVPAAKEGMTTVFNYVDEEIASIIVNDKEVQLGEHGWGFLPLIKIDKNEVPGEPFGYPLLYLPDVRPLQKQLNLLFSAALELALDLAFPPILEYNKALQGLKVEKWRRRKIPVKRTDKGESLAYFTPGADMAALLTQIERVLDMIHFTTQMPRAALGLPQANTTSGFQMRLQMQPAAMQVESAQIDFDWAFQKMVKMILKILEKEQPSIFTLDLEDGQKVELKELWRTGVHLEWQPTTPVDQFRKVQMEMLKLQNSLTSLYQAIEAIGDSNPQNTIDMMKQEAELADVAPDRVIKVAQARQAARAFVEQAGATASRLSDQIKLPEELRQAADMLNEKNALMGLGEDRREPKLSPETAREAVTFESTAEGGGAPPPPEEE